MRERILHREDPAPRLAEEHEVVRPEPQCHAHLLHLVDEARDVPQLRVVRLVAVGRAELVVVDVFNARRGQERVEPFEVFVRGARPAVQQQHLEPRVVADALRPDTEVTVLCVDRDHGHAARQRVRAPFLVEVARVCRWGEATRAQKQRERASAKGSFDHGHSLLGWTAEASERNRSRPHASSRADHRGAFVRASSASRCCCCAGVASARTRNRQRGLAPASSGSNSSPNQSSASR